MLSGLSLVGALAIFAQVAQVVSLVYVPAKSLHDLNNLCETYQRVPEAKVLVIKLIEQDGWQHNRTRGSHRQYNHPTRSGVVTISGHPGDEVAPGTLNSILKQAGLKR
jgi:predicted RNA binding protein YcfA (HicA-like mRNA interferase family)